MVAAHPDDEILGCGGTIARHVAEGDQVSILIVAEGATARGENGEVVGVELAALKEAAAQAARVLGAENPIMLGLPDNRLDSIPLLDIIHSIESVITKTAPSVIYTHHHGDLNIDHHIVHSAVLTACRPLPAQSVRQIFTFETVSSTEWAIVTPNHQFSPTRFVNIGETMDKKIKALSCYHMEMRPFPHARSIDAVEALAKLRGSSVGLVAAEAFQVIRDIHT